MSEARHGAARRGGKEGTAVHSKFSRPAISFEGENWRLGCRVRLRVRVGICVFVRTATRWFLRICGHSNSWEST
eukprot:1394846-Amorphochlora_amoeboformis.AAC.1